MEKRGLFSPIPMYLYFMYCEMIWNCRDQSSVAARANVGRVR